MAEAKSLKTYLDLIRDKPSEFRTVSRAVNPMEFDVTAILGLLDRRGGPVLVGERLVKAHLRQREDGDRVGLVLDRLLHPERRVEQVVLRRSVGGDGGNGETSRQHGGGEPGWTKLSVHA